MRGKSSTDFVSVHKKAIKKLIHSYVWEKKVQSSQLTVVDASQPSVNKLQPFQFRPRGQVNVWPILKKDFRTGRNLRHSPKSGLIGQTRSLYTYILKRKQSFSQSFLNQPSTARYPMVRYQTDLLDVSDEQRNSLNVWATLASQFCGLVVSALTCNSRPALLISTESERAYRKGLLRVHT